MIKRGQVILALTNPYPEIDPEVAVKAGAAFAADGTSVNNVLGYPGIFRGALLSGAREINVQMKLAAAHVIADLTEASTSCTSGTCSTRTCTRGSPRLCAMRPSRAGWRGWSACRRRGWQAGGWTRPPSTAQRLEEEVGSVPWEIVPVRMM